MEASRWERVEAFFHRAAELDEKARSALLGEVCAEDPVLAAEVARMLAADGRAAFATRMSPPSRKECSKTALPRR